MKFLIVYLLLYRASLDQFPCFLLVDSSVRPSSGLIHERPLTSPSHARLAPPGGPPESGGGSHKHPLKPLGCG